MRLDDLLEAEIIQFPGTQKPVSKTSVGPRSYTNEVVLKKLQELNKQSIAKQRDLALPTVMSGQPKGIKPVVAWAVALDEISHIGKKSQIQQWIYDQGREIIDRLIGLNRQDIKDYQQLYDIKMEPWETGRTSAEIYKYKQVDKTAQDLLLKFKREQVDNRL